MASLKAAFVALVTLGAALSSPAPRLAMAQVSPDQLDEKMANDPAPWTVPGKWGPRGNWGAGASRTSAACSTSSPRR